VTYLSSNSSLQDVLEVFVSLLNTAQNVEGTPSGGIDEYQLFQKMEELRSTIDNLGGHVGMIANNGQLIEGHLETISSAIVKVVEGDDDRLMERLKAKVRANYETEREMLDKFQRYLFENYGAHFPDAIPNAVDGFLEQVDKDV